MKFLLLLLVLGVAAVLLTARGRGPSSPAPPKRGKRADARGEPMPMLACVHCGVHLPQSEALIDAAGRPYCSEAHRLAGPRRPA